MKRNHSLAILLTMAMGSMSLCAQRVPAPGSRTLMDAHNCYPYFEWWSDRIDRALSAGTPLAIEQDLAWFTDPRTGASRSVVTHGDPLTGEEPGMEDYFFKRVKPIVEQAIKDGNRGNWPIITLNLDFKDNKPEHIASVRALLLHHREWISEAARSSDGTTVAPLQVKPILVLTGEADEQQVVFHDRVAVGEPILAFGAIHSGEKDPQGSAAAIGSEKASNYRRWWNNPWEVIEPEGQAHATSWSPSKAARLKEFVDRAHANGLWIRFYTLDGSPKQDLSAFGWFRTYNFGSLEAARLRWDAAIAAHVDYIASDQYELLGKEVRSKRP